MPVWRNTNPCISSINVKGTKFYLNFYFTMLKVIMTGNITLISIFIRWCQQDSIPLFHPKMESSSPAYDCTMPSGIQLEECWCLELPTNRVSRTCPSFGSSRTISVLRPGFLSSINSICLPCIAPRTTGATVMLPW